VSARRAPFFDLVRLPFVTSHNVSLIQLHFTREFLLWLCRRNDARAQLLTHALRIVFMQTQLVGNLPVRQVQSHQVQTTYPHRQALVAACKNGLTQVIEVVLTRLTAVVLSLRLLGVVALLADRVTPATWAPHLFRPAHLANHVIALGVIEQTGQQHGLLLELDLILALLDANWRW
jgi:hypothetical protein